MKITLSKLPFKKKSYEVKQSVRNMRQTYKLQLIFAENGDMDGKDDAEVVNSMLGVFDQAIDYITNVLKLSDEQSTELEDMTQDDLLETANTLAMELMGLSSEDSKKK